MEDSKTYLQDLCPVSSLVPVTIHFTELYKINNSGCNSNASV